MRLIVVSTLAVLVASAAFLVTLDFSSLSGLPGLSPVVILVISDLGQLLAAGFACLGCAVAARRVSGRLRRAWALLSAGTGAWAGGQMIWTTYEVALDRQVPFPSLADVGFLAFPLLAAAGLVVWLGASQDQLLARGRDLMDGLIIACSVAAISWITVLGAVVEAGASGSAATLALSIAYPVGDVVLAALVLLHLSRARREDRATLVMLAAGLCGFALADSLFVYLTSTSTYSSADLISSGGWFAGFAFVGAAGFSVSHAPSRPSPREVDRPADRTWSQLLLPYVSLVVAATAVASRAFARDSSLAPDLAMGTVLIGLVLGRQLLAMVDNHRLVLALSEASAQLEHQALHDTLTGLPNRALFADRLDHALRRPTALVSVLFCDLDDFKLVNDKLGHEAGDAMLGVVARRLLACVRPTDTVARLGGDEFAILLDDSGDGHAVAERVMESMREEVEIRGTRVAMSISVGVAQSDSAEPDHTGGSSVPENRLTASPTPARRSADTSRGRADAGVARREESAALLMRLADQAMYAAKGASKGRVVNPTPHAGMFVNLATARPVTL